MPLTAISNAAMSGGSGPRLKSSVSATELPTRSKQMQMQMVVPVHAGSGLQSTSTGEGHATHRAVRPPTTCSRYLACILPARPHLPPSTLVIDSPLSFASQARPDAPQNHFRRPSSLRRARCER